MCVCSSCKSAEFFGLGNLFICVRFVVSTCLVFCKAWGATMLSILAKLVPSHPESLNRGKRGKSDDQCRTLSGLGRNICVYNGDPSVHVYAPGILEIHLELVT